MTAIETIPGTVKQATKLKKLLAKPLKIQFIEDKIYKLILDEDFFDELNEIRYFEGDKYDCRKEIKDYIHDLLLMNQQQPWRFEGMFEPDALLILKSIIQ